MNELNLANKGKNIAFIFMGSSGSGKSHVGRLISEKFKFHFVEGDDFHSSTNIEKMSSNVPLTDSDRQPWLHSIKNAIIRKLFVNNDDCSGIRGVVVTCSALKYKYREFIRNYDLYNDNDNVEMLESQLSTLEEPTEEPRTIIINSDNPMDKVVEETSISITKIIER
ncbi:9052_t:CDS:2 [Entrophospora sp. SA101]|nr:9052_t:CDS:2 [Entrophospora sp. SA101]CAJ0829064.1 14926_t:CDS:2 [Entrophospora sp. SA101]